jgi:hypothetical protein
MIHRVLGRILLVEEPFTDESPSGAEMLTPAALAELGRQLAAALERLHATGAAHGAVSLAALYRTRDGRLDLDEGARRPLATPSGDVRGAAALLLTLVPREAWWAPEAEKALEVVDTVRALRGAMDELEQLASREPGRPNHGMPRADGESAVQGETADALAASALTGRPAPALEGPILTSDVVIAAHETAEAEASPELELSAQIGHVAMDLAAIGERSKELTFEEVDAEVDPDPMPREE